MHATRAEQALQAATRAHKADTQREVAELRREMLEEKALEIAALRKECADQKVPSLTVASASRSARNEVAWRDHGEYNKGAPHSVRS